MRAWPHGWSALAIGTSAVIAGILAHTAGFASQDPVDPTSHNSLAAYHPKVEEYVVEPGDTFWGICNAVLDAPWLWPQVWAYNPEITNPNWIYPGDVIRFYPPVEPLPSLQRAMTASATRVEDVDAALAARRSAAGDDDDAQGKALPKVEVISYLPPRPSAAQRGLGRLQQPLTFFVSQKELQAAGEVAHAVPDAMLLSRGDVVVLRFGAPQQPAVGDQYLVYRTVNAIHHPRTGAGYGHITQVTGVARVIGIDSDTVVKARLMRTFTEVERGHRVAPYRDPTVDVTPRPADAPVEGTIVATQEGGRAVVGTRQLVFVDRGQAHGLQTGMQLHVVRKGDAFHADKPRGDHAVNIATLVVLDAREDVATCMVVKAKREVQPGDVVRGAVAP